MFFYLVYIFVPIVIILLGVWGLTHFSKLSNSRRKIAAIIAFILCAVFLGLILYFLSGEFCKENLGCIGINAFALLGSIIFFVTGIRISASSLVAWVVFL